MNVGLVCDRCDTFSPMSSPTCTTCGSPLTLEEGPNSPVAAFRNAQPTPPETRAPAAGPAAPRECKQCGALVAGGYRFCGACGNSLDGPTARPAGVRVTNFFGELQQQRAKLVLIRGDGLDGISYTLAGKEHLAGRSEGELLFPDDPFLSPRHANFFYKTGQLWVHDEHSANGVYVRIRTPVPLGPGDTFLVGEQVMRFDATPPETAGLGPDHEGTYVVASPRRASRIQLTQLLRGGDIGTVVRASRDAVTFGRDGNDIDFPDDPFISGKHAEVTVSDAGVTLSDLGSKNGTFLRVTRDQQLLHGDYVFMGQQLLRVEIV